jgi:iron(II)-dependent oxidoreductase
MQKRGKNGELAEMLRDSRKRTLELVIDLDDKQMIGPRISGVNPPLWEIGHLAWFQERWNLRRREGTIDHFEPSKILENGDELYNSSEVAHDTRWELPLLSRQQTVAYMQRVLERVIEQLDAEDPDPELAYYVRLSIFHEDMHDEAFTYTRHTHGLPLPPLPEREPSAPEDQPRGPLKGDVEIPGGEFMLGASSDDPIPFVFDNEKWAHPVEVAPFKISRAPVTNEQFRGFVEDGGYLRRELWSEEGWRWLESVGAEHPIYWSKDGEGWSHRRFDHTEPLPPHQPIMFVSWYEAEAYCNWAGRRLPTEAEWEMAAAAEPTPDGSGITGRKRTYPWGDEPLTQERANLDALLPGPVDVAAFPEGESAFGLRQMMGNVWEWCADAFQPYPGFHPDPYEDYSQPWFGDHMVLRGGCWTTRGRVLRNTWRNFYTPDRRDVFTGFRTCAL